MCVSFTVGAVFVFAGTSKLAHPQEFLDAILGYDLVGERVSRAATYFAPCLEITIGLSLLLRLAVPGALLMAVCLTALFAMIQAIALVRGLDISCGCGVFGDSHVGAISLGKTLALSGGSGASLLWLRVAQRPDPAIA